jgi:hypothetical protein
MTDVEDADRLRVAAPLATGMTVREIAEEIGIGKSVGAPDEAAIEQEEKEAAAEQDEGEYRQTVPRRFNVFIVPREMLHAHAWCRRTFMEDHASLPMYASRPRVGG